MDVTNSMVHRVINTTELIELILLDDNIRMDQLFVLQRVSKRLQTVIAGSQMPIFRHFGFELERSEGSELQNTSLVSRHPLAGAVEKKLKPHLGGSWEGLKISRIPLTLGFRYGDTEVPDLSLNGRTAVLGDLVNKLNTWYTYMRRQPRRMTNAVLVADLHFH
jgi:hypothetical protein